MSEAIPCPPCGAPDQITEWRRDGGNRTANRT
jgi:hypothetical protein